MIPIAKINIWEHLKCKFIQFKKDIGHMLDVLFVLKKSQVFLLFLYDNFRILRNYP